MSSGFVFALQFRDPASMPCDETLARLKTRAILIASVDEVFTPPRASIKYLFGVQGLLHNRHTRYVLVSGGESAYARDAVVNLFCGETNAAKPKYVVDLRR